MKVFNKSYKLDSLLIIVVLLLALIGCSKNPITTYDNEDIIKPVIINEEKNKDILTIEDSATNTIVENTTYEIKKSPYKELFTRNNDYIGWITINDTNIDLPIVKGKDNDEYLRRNFDYEKDQKGSIFMDYRNFGFGYSKNTILYGHNLKDDSMFGDLKNYTDLSYGLNHNIIEITDLYGTRKFQVFSSYFGAADSNLITTDFSTAPFSDYLSNINQLSIVDYDLMPSQDDHILTLVTCSYEIDDGRFFVHAVEILD